jgi:PqqD family protein of HPr-rel-A system
MTGEWSLVYPGRFDWKNFGPEWVVYDDASNQTVVLDAVEFDVFLCLAAGPVTEEQLIATVLEDLQLEANDESLAMVQVTLSKLESARLIQQLHNAPI